MCRVPEKEFLNLVTIRDLILTLIRTSYDSYAHRVSSIAP